MLCPGWHSREGEHKAGEEDTGKKIENGELQCLKHVLRQRGDGDPDGEIDGDKEECHHIYQRDRTVEGNSENDVGGKKDQ